MVDPIASAVTSVTLEHTHILGDTVEEIAYDKAHVAPEDAPLVAGTTGDALAAVREVADDVVTVGEGDDADVTATYDGREGLEGAVSVDGSGWRVDTYLPLLGAHQAQNAGIAASLCPQVADIARRRFTAASETPTGRVGSRSWARSRRSSSTARTTPTPRAHRGDAILVRLRRPPRRHRCDGRQGPRAHRRGAAGPGPRCRCQPTVDRAESHRVVAAAVENATAATVETRSDVAGALEIALDAADSGDAVLVVGSLTPCGRPGLRGHGR
ncbi:hypothetical protein C9J85_00940 [Haloferax sp. wsp5]|nr:hypothetical protein C9J85_00940 [Haloferax sp. wsp5]